MNVRFKRIKKKIINELNKLDKKIDKFNIFEKLNIFIILKFNSFDISVLELIEELLLLKVYLF
jgi:hypothetical protein